MTACWKSWKRYINEEKSLKTANPIKNKEKRQFRDIGPQTSDSGITLVTSLFFAVEVQCSLHWRSLRGVQGASLFHHPQCGSSWHYVAHCTSVLPKIRWCVHVFTGAARRTHWSILQVNSVLSVLCLPSGFTLTMLIFSFKSSLCQFVCQPSRPICTVKRKCKCVHVSVCTQCINRTQSPAAVPQSVAGCQHFCSLSAESYAAGKLPVRLTAGSHAVWRGGCHGEARWIRSHF